MENSNTTKTRISNFLNDVKSNITEGAAALSKMSGEFIEEVKEKAEELYEAGYEKFEHASAVVQDYIDRYEGNREIKELKEEKKELNALLGDAVFHEFKKNGTVSKRFLTTKKMSALMDDIQKVDKKILKIGKDLDKKK